MVPLFRKVALSSLAALWPVSISMRLLSKEPPHFTVQQIWNNIKKVPQDVKLQSDACSGLHMLGRESFQNVDAKGQGRISTQLLEEGIGEALAQGLLNILASEQSLSNISTSAAYCFAGLADLGDVVNTSWADTFVHHSPSVLRAMVGYVMWYLKRQPEGVAAILEYVKPWLSIPEAVPALQDTGSFNLLFELLQSDTIGRDTKQSVWGIIQPAVQVNDTTALSLANHDGPGKGIEFIMQTMREANRELFSIIQFNTVAAANAILFRDDTNKTFLQAFVRAGLLESVLESMRDWPVSRGHQDYCCQIIKQATDGNVTNQGIVVGLGALELMAADLSAFHKDARRPTEGAFSPVHSCSAALLNIARGLPTSRQQMLWLGVPQMLDLSAHHLNMEFWKGPWNSSSHFPFSNVITLKNLLSEGVH